MTGSAASIINCAEAFGVILEVRGDILRCGSSAPMPPALRDTLREHKLAVPRHLRFGVFQPQALFSLRLSLFQSATLP
jgi:hypothetical protein